jgi:hypothetical protein
MASRFPNEWLIPIDGIRAVSRIPDHCRSSIGNVQGRRHRACDLPCAFVAARLLDAAQRGKTTLGELGSSPGKLL